ncbi:HU family DNA-binding protein [Mollicutes bacterium LVI A0039]|nr:HU family DNA-binding protein [Mollicutes bacterium LVI A0039]
MTKNEMIEKVVESTELSKKDVATVIDATLNEIKEAIKSGDKINFVGFGSFEPKTNKARTGINPATKEKIQISESQSVKFKVSKTFKDYLN